MDLPFPAADDPLLARLFGPEAVEGRTVRAAAGLEAEGEDWKVVALTDARGRAFLLERTVRGDAEETLAGPLDQAAWIRIVERFRAPPSGSVLTGDYDGWLDFGNELAASSGWDLDAERAMWDRVRPDGPASAEEPAAMTTENAALDAEIPDAEIPESRIADTYAPHIDAAIEAGKAATRDVRLLEAFGPDRLRGLTLIWSLADLHGPRPWRGCVLLEDDGTSHLAELTVDAAGVATATLSPLTLDRWEEIGALACWRLLSTEDERYVPAAEGVGPVSLALDMKLLEGRSDTGSDRMGLFHAMAEAAAAQRAPGPGMN